LSVVTTLSELNRKAEAKRLAKGIPENPEPSSEVVVESALNDEPDMTKVEEQLSATKKSSLELQKKQTLTLLQHQMIRKMLSKQLKESESESSRERTKFDFANHSHVKIRAVPEATTELLYSHVENRSMFAPVQKKMAKRFRVNRLQNARRMYTSL
jgi:hypothetical protein